MPTIDDLVVLFEMLDVDHNGYLTPNEMRRFILNMQLVV